MSMKLAILGLLMEGDSHTYEIRHKMKERGMDNYMKIQEGSLYYAMDQLKKDGFVDAIEVVKDGNRPDRTIYSITEAGKAEFQELLFKQLELPERFLPPLYLGLTFARHGNEDHIAAVLQEKITQCELKVEEIKNLYIEHIPQVSRVVLHMMYGWFEHMETELKWLKRLHRDAQLHRLKEIGHPLDLD